jgi:(p)ppGpp synthase/HD superfamily hydrolase
MTVAVLHDVVEDTEVTLDDLSSEFGHVVVEAIDALSRRGKAERYVDFIARAKSNPISRMVKIADIEHNLTDLKPGSMRDKYELALHILKSGGPL